MQHASPSISPSLYSDDNPDRQAALQSNSPGFPSPTTPVIAYVLPALYSPTPSLLPPAHHGVSASDVQTAVGTAYNVLNPKGGMIAVGVSLVAGLTGLYLDPWSALQNAMKQLDEVKSLLDDASRQPGMRRYFPIFIRQCNDHISIFSYELTNNTLRARKRGPLIMRATFMLPQSLATRNFAKKMTGYLDQLHDDIETSTTTAAKWLAEGRAKGCISKDEQLAYATAISEYNKTKSLPREAIPEDSTGLLSRFIRWYKDEASATRDSLDLEANLQPHTSVREDDGGILRHTSHGANSRRPQRPAPDPGDVELDTYRPAVLSTDIATGEVTLVIPSESVSLEGNAIVAPSLSSDRSTFHYLATPAEARAATELSGASSENVCQAYVSMDSGTFDGTEEFLDGPEDIALALNRLFSSEETSISFDS